MIDENIFTSFIHVLDFWYHKHENMQCFRATFFILEIKEGSCFIKIFHRYLLLCLKLGKRWLHYCKIDRTTLKKIDFKRNIKYHLWIGWFSRMNRFAFSQLPFWSSSIQGVAMWQKSWFRRKNTFCSQSLLHHLLSISQFFEFSNLTSNSNFVVDLLICQDGWMVRALDSHARDPWFKSLWHQAFLFRKGSQKFFKKWLSIRRITVWITVKVNLCRPLHFIKVPTYFTINNFTQICMYFYYTWILSQRGVADEFKSQNIPKIFEMQNASQNCRENLLWKRPLIYAVVMYDKSF